MDILSIHLSIYNFKRELAYMRLLMNCEYVETYNFHRKNTKNMFNILKISTNR